ncbi:2,5-diketo-D-gluconic acid reductase B [Pseudoclavibacter triregionum]|nr:2,5-diketo-D-gluconic acid reductase B [Pseudoclavibacter triregionum]
MGTTILDLPAVGFGTYTLKGEAGADAVAGAIERGYRLIDSAFNYENEGAVGKGVREGLKRAGIDRDELIVTSKLPGRRHAKDEARVTIEESLLRTGLDRLDLYLIHWPNPAVDRYVEAWEALLEARERGLVREVGVCNFLPEHLERLERETGVLPAVNQIELHPRFPQAEQLAWHEARGIATEAWSPLARGREVLERPEVTAIAERLGVAPGQVVLAWHVARGVVPIPKSSSPERQAENLAAAGIRLSEEDVAAITAIGRPDGRLKDQDPARYEEM